MIGLQDGGGLADKDALLTGKFAPIPVMGGRHGPGKLGPLTSDDPLDDWPISDVLPGGVIVRQNPRFHDKGRKERIAPPKSGKTPTTATGLYYKGRPVPDIIKEGMEDSEDWMRGAITGHKDKGILPFLGDVGRGMERGAQRHYGNLLDTLGIPRDYGKRLGLTREKKSPPVATPPKGPFDWDKKVEEYRKLEKKRAGHDDRRRQSGGMIGLQDGDPVKKQDGIIRERLRKRKAQRDADIKKKLEEMEKADPRLRPDALRPRVIPDRDPVEREKSIERTLEDLEKRLLIDNIDKFFERRDIQKNRGKQFPKFEDLPKIHPWQHGIHGPEDEPLPVPTPQVPPLDLPDAPPLPKRPTTPPAVVPRPPALPDVPPTGVSPADIPKPPVVEPAPSPPPTGLQK